MRGPCNFCSYWDGQLKPHFASSPGPIRLDSMLWYMFDIPRYDLEVSEELNIDLPNGDWVFRSETSVEERLAALEEIIRSKMNRTIRFERRTIQRKTVVVTGKYSFTPAFDGRPDCICIYVDKNESLNWYGWQVDSLRDLFREIGNELEVAFLVRTEQTAIPKIPYQFSSETDVNGSRGENLPIVLNNLAKQTGLNLTIETLPAEVWFATEKTGD
jgi:hypothetical protein